MTDDANIWAWYADRHAHGWYVRCGPLEITDTGVPLDHAIAELATFISEASAVLARLAEGKPYGQQHTTN